MARRKPNQPLPPGTMDVKIVTHFLLPDQENLDAVMLQMRRAVSQAAQKIARRFKGEWLATRGDILLDRRRAAGCR